MPNSDDFLVVAKILVAKDQNSCSELFIRRRRKKKKKFMDLTGVQNKATVGLLVFFTLVTLV